MDTLTALSLTPLFWVAIAFIVCAVFVAAAIWRSGRRSLTPTDLYCAWADLWLDEHRGDHQ